MAEVSFPLCLDLHRLASGMLCLNLPSFWRVSRCLGIPDFVVTGPDFAWKGHGGMVAAGYFDGAWGLAERSAVFYC